jgi:predicted nucleic acid-binding protein
LLVDTNVLLEATDAGRTLHAQALALFQFAPEDGVDLFIGTQVVREYLVVATRPIANNGLGMHITSAIENIRSFGKRASLVPETLRAGEVFVEWATRFEIQGKKLHDLQILATASVAGMDMLITANDRDFPADSPLPIISLSKYER